MECAPVRAQAWLDGLETDVRSCSIDAVVALIENAGLRARVLPYGTDGTTTEQHGDRVDVRLTAAGALAGLDAG